MITTLSGEFDAVSPWFAPTGHARNVKSAERTLALFELFSLHQRPMTVGEIAKSLNIPQPSVSMLLRNLATLGYLDHDRISRTYVPSVRIVLLGSWIQRRFSEQGAIESRLDNLTNRLRDVLSIRATVLLGIQNGVYSQYVLVQMPRNPDLLVQSGMLRPITRTAVGRVLLSQKPDSEIEALVRRCNAEVTEERLRVRPADFLESMRRVRRDGYAETSGDMTPGRASIAVPVLGPASQTPMAVAVGGLSEQVHENREVILAALREFQAGYGETVAMGAERAA